MPGVNVRGTRGPKGAMPCPMIFGGGGMIGTPVGDSIGCGERASG